MKVLTNASVESVDTSGELCKVTVKTKKGEELIEAEIVLFRGWNCAKHRKYWD